MSVKKSQRITVSGRNLTFLRNLAAEMDENDLTAALSYLLTDIRCLGYQIGVKPAPRTLQASLGFEQIAPIRERNHQEIDPIINRISQLIEEF